MIRSVVVCEPSGNDVRIEPMLAQVLLPGLAKEPVIVNSKVAIGAMASSQKALIPSWPWCPRPSGSNMEGPTGSSSTASSAYTVSHSARSPFATAE